MKRNLCILGLLAFMGLQAQTGKVGINTDAPTEILDVEGTLRVRDLPAEGGNIYNSTTSTTKTATFTPKYNIVADANGVLGKEEVSASGASSGITPIFMKRRYTTGDWPSGRGRVGTDTGVSHTEYDAILTINGIKRSASTESGMALFYQDGHGLELDLMKGNSGTWRVVGDIGGMNEEWQFTILFIKRDFMIESNDTPTAISK